MAARLGGLLLALGSGTRSELRRALGIAIVGGLLFSQMLTLYTTPVVYLHLDRLRLALGGVPAAAGAAPGARRGLTVSRPPGTPTYTARLDERGPLGEHLRTDHLEADIGVRSARGGAVNIGAIALATIGVFGPVKDAGLFTATVRFFAKHGREPASA